MQFSPRVQDALDSVDEDYYTLHPDGRLVTQTTVAWLIASTLDRLDVRPGTRVLEIGTGSGFSGALLAELVGDGGAVVSVDVVPDLADRARELHRRRGRGGIEVRTADGREGAPDHGPFDRIVAWATPDLIPQAWVDQAAPGALLITPVQVTPLVKTNAVVVAHVAADGRIAADSLFPGGYVEMHGEVLTQWLVPPRGVDALAHDADGAPWWIAAPWAAEDRQAAERLLRTLMSVRSQRLLTEDESVQDFTAYLYAVRPEELSIVGTGSAGWRLGCTSGDGAALLDRGTGADVVHTGDRGALDTLLGWTESWREAGRPGYAEVCPVLRQVDGGWEVRLAMASKGRYA
ncbi:protein-L-isoaspartate(D-aspartate) O-methyltransferase [Spinactinospora alkalitolerans]|uniref:Protein-L-isoaspartate O-methyltransferase n=1 Tax=Spinactinospora alkalitolerans TaxID=687207 RepID=A0A852TZV9_9ACTN|nr:methyltransferase domain-containing protein [Spinactinospora alkalitolerans]NYE48845.1 protein-L-isoaspartate(D-aspartate) O-methyltransferase [Spinactinospora alkalitolerans]